MNYRFPILLILLGQILFSGDLSAAASSAMTGHCASPEGPMLQVLGSGGPIADDGRASSAYLIWVDGKSRFLVDAGGGTFLRFGEAGAQFDSLQHVAISHFHTDHATDLVALLKSGYFSDRTSALPISGPGGDGDYPGLQTHLESLLNPDSGAFAYLSGYLDGSEGLVKLEATEVDARPGNSVQVYSDPENAIRIRAMGVQHGPVPALAYRIEIGDKSIVFSGDQNGNLDKFIGFAANADVLVMHMPVPENITGTGRKLHAPPGIIGKIAALADAKTLILSHFMARSLNNIEENLQFIRSRYSGSIEVSRDLDCFKF